MIKRNHQKQLQVSQKRGTAALSLFGRAYEELDQANAALNKLALDARAKAAELLKHAADAEAEITANVAVQNQLSALVR